MEKEKSPPLPILAPKSPPLTMCSKNKNPRPKTPRFLCCGLAWARSCSSSGLNNPLRPYTNSILYFFEAYDTQDELYICVRLSLSPFIFLFSNSLFLYFSYFIIPLAFCFQKERRKKKDIDYYNICLTCGSISDQLFRLGAFRYGSGT